MVRTVYLCVASQAAGAQQEAGGTTLNDAVSAAGTDLRLVTVMLLVLVLVLILIRIASTGMVIVIATVAKAAATLPGTGSVTGAESCAVIVSARAVLADAVASAS